MIKIEQLKKRTRSQRTSTLTSTSHRHQRQQNQDLNHRNLREGQKGEHRKMMMRNGDNDVIRNRDCIAQKAEEAQ